MQENVFEFLFTKCLSDRTSKFVKYAFLQGAMSKIQPNESIQTQNRRKFNRGMLNALMFLIELREGVQNKVFIGIKLVIWDLFFLIGPSYGRANSIFDRELIYSKLVAAMPLKSPERVEQGRRLVFLGFGTSQFILFAFIQRRSSETRSNWCLGRLLVSTLQRLIVCTL